MYIACDTKNNIPIVLVLCGLLITSFILASVFPSHIHPKEGNESEIQDDLNEFHKNEIKDDNEVNNKLGTRTGDYDLNFSTYLGGSDWEHMRDIFADSHGDVYVVGGTASNDFPTTSGAYDRTFDFGGSDLGNAGPCDAVIVKYNSNGSLNWSTYLGGPNYDRAYAVEVDSLGYVYVAGRAGPSFPVTPGAFQTTFNGSTKSQSTFYGAQNGFVAKLSPNGSTLIWASYVGVAELCRDLAIDDIGDIYLPFSHPNFGKDPPQEWFSNAYQNTTKGGKECGAIKVKGDGSQVLWATWLGGSGDDYQEASIRVDSGKNVYLAMTTFSNDINTTPGAYDRTYNGGGDFYVAKLTSDGSDLIFATYIGSTSDDWINTHNLALDSQGNAFVSIPAHSDFPTTPGAYQEGYAGGATDIAVAKFYGTNGSLIASTFIGGIGFENPDGVYTDDSGNVYLSGQTDSTNFPFTDDAYQSSNGGGNDAVIFGLSSNLSRLLYSTYLGGGSNDDGRTSYLGQDGMLYLAGQTNGPGWPIKNAYQSSYQGGNLDGIVTKFSPPGGPGPNIITVNPKITYQSIVGWEAVAWAMQDSSPAFDNFSNELIDLAVTDLGINRLRVEIRACCENSVDYWSQYQAGDINYSEWRSHRYTNVNDNNDPYDINWSGFYFSELDNTVEKIVLPMKQKMEAKGDKLYINVNYVAFTGQNDPSADYIHDDPDEYAEFVLATYLHLQSNYSLVPDYWEVILEPDNVAEWNGPLIGNAVDAAANRLASSGFNPSFVAPATTSMSNAISYFDALIAIPGVKQNLTEYSYHRYSGVSDANLKAIADRGTMYGVNTSMLEWWHNSNGYAILHKDLKMGNNSAWQHGVLGGSTSAKMACYTIDDTDPAHPIVSIHPKAKFTRQYYKFVKSGAVRINATSNNHTFDPVAFNNTDGGHVVVVKADQGGSFSIVGLPAGFYGIKYTTSNEYDIDLPDQLISAGEWLNTGIPEAGVITVYGKIERNFTFLPWGWNLISIPFIQSNTNLGAVLSSITGSYDTVEWYNVSDNPDHWKINSTSKPPYLNDLDSIDHTMGFWIHITEPSGVLFEYPGTPSTINQTITLHPGWNLVGYPSLTSYNRTDGLNNLIFGENVDAIWTYNAATERWKELDQLDYFEVGKGYWIYSKVTITWIVPH